MIRTGRRLEDRSKSRLFLPIVALTLGMLSALVLLSAFLLVRFNATAAERETHVVRNGIERQVDELNKVVATQVNWDDAILNLDNRFNQSWADFNIGSYLFTFNHITHSFVVDAQGRAIYAAVQGRSAPLDHYRHFAATAQQLMPSIRKAERRRGPVKPRPGKDNILVPSIQADTFARVDGQVYIVTATLVQPDFGKVMPRGQQAPVVIAAVPLNRTFQWELAKRYLLDRVQVFEVGPAEYDGPSIVLTDTAGAPVATLGWRASRPGTQLLEELAVPIAAVIALLALLAGSVIRRGASMVSELIASEARARHLACHDPLTRLPNRALLFARLRPLLAGIARSGRPVAVLCVDLDRFKEINDSLGHHAGDLLIESVAMRLRSVCADAALIARMGGDEFVVLLEGAEASQVDSIANAIVASVRAPVESEYGQMEVGCSVGYAVIDQAGIDPFEALRWADLALYRSKDMGRSLVTRFEPEMDEALRSRRSLESDLRTALAEGTLTMVYQPQVNRSGEVITYEALVRWTHSERGAIPPGLFIPLAEECGLIMALGEFVLRRVFDETRNWHTVRTAINVSAVQMRAPGFAAVVTRMVASAGVNPEHYEIELTETALLGNDPATAANIEALKRLGFTIALDDFGTGYSSLSVLQRFSVDKIKIDRSFISCLGSNDESEALVDAMIRLARALDLCVIAEGVETEEQREQLIRAGCREFQGHLIGHPQSARQVADSLGDLRHAFEPQYAVS